MSGLKNQLKMLGTALLGKRASKPVKKKPLTDAEICHLRTAFDLLDRNRDGHVTANELQFMLKNLGINVRDELIDDLIKEASHTGNGLIDEAEFLQWVARIQALREDSESTSKQEELDDVTQDLIAAFRVFDRDGNGFITRDELQTAMDMIGESLTENQLTELLAIADLDKDGRINYEVLQGIEDIVASITAAQERQQAIDAAEAERHRRTQADEERRSQQMDAMLALLGRIADRLDRQT